MKLTEKNPLGKTGLTVPPIIYGTSYLGNLYRALPCEDKLALMRKWFECTEKPDSEKGRIIYSWRGKFNEICARNNMKPSDACIHFSFSHPAIVSMALNTGKPEKMNRYVEILQRIITDAFRKEMKAGTHFVTLFIRRPGHPGPDEYPNFQP